MNKRVKTIIRIVAIVLISALIGISIYSINAERLNGNALPMPLGFAASVVLSGSMEPELSTGDLIFVVSADEYNVDDVVVFQTGRIAVVHRIISIDGDSVITKGDANNIEDSPIPLSAIKGKVVLAIPLVGYLVNIIKTPIGTIILLGLAVLLLESSFKKEKTERENKIDELREEIEKLKSEQN